MLSLLLLIMLALAARVASVIRPRTTLAFDIRDALLIGALCVGVWSWGGAELLGLLRAFAPVPVRVWWLAPVPVLGIIAWKRSAQAQWPAIGFPRGDRLALALVAITVLMLLLTGAMAFLTPPTTHDVLSYHMPRQVYWIQNHCVDAYPSNDLRQIEMPPLAEYIGAQMMFLSGTDHQANLVQWFSLVLTALGASAVARDMGGNARTQAFAALLVVFNPAAATQAENGKNDIVVALWTLTLLWIAVRVWLLKRVRVCDAAAAGISLGLLLMTKGTGYVLAPPMCLLFAWVALRSNWKKAIPLGALVLVLTATIVAPFWARNYKVLGSPLRLSKEKGGFDLENETHSPAALTSSLVRNLSLHTNLPIDAVNKWEFDRIQTLHEWMGINESDLRITSPRNLKFVVRSDWNSDGNNPAPVHLFLGVAMVVGLCNRKFLSRPVWPVFLIPFAQMFLFAAMLKWQPWNVRLHIPIVATAAVPLAVWMQGVRFGTRLVALSAAGVAFAAVLFNLSKPLIGPLNIWGQSREEIMFHNAPHWRARMHDVADLVQKLNPRVVALDFEFGSLEYLIMRTLLDHMNPPPKLVPMRTFLGLKGPSQEAPDCAISHRPQHYQTMEHGPSGTRMSWLSTVADYRLYVPERALAAVRPAFPIPEFFGWDEASGLSPAEGPYPQWELPTVRWAKEKSLTLTFMSDGTPMHLSMRCRRNDSPNQTMSVMLDDRSVLQESFGTAWEFRTYDIPLNCPSGKHTITFTFGNTESETAPRSVLFSRLQIFAVRQQAPTP